MKKYLFSIISVFVVACSNQSTPSGVVAVVNGSYITLNELRDRYDVQTMHISEFTVPPVDSFHKEYTETLLEMIVELAIEQELKNNKIAISDDAVNKAVREIQGGYSDEEFSQMLAERYIDFESWKKQIRAGVIEQIYLRQILAQNLSATESEIKEFYKNNPSLFLMDMKISGEIISSKEKEVVENAVYSFEHNVPKEKVIILSPTLAVESIVADSSNLPMEYIDEIFQVALNKATSVHQNDGIYSAVFVKNRQKDVKLSLEEGWNIAQSYVIENKAKALYDSSIEAILKKASIQVVDEFKSAMDIMLGNNVTISDYAVKEETQEG